MMTRLSRPVAEHVMLLAARLDLSYSETLALLIEIALTSDRLPELRLDNGRLAEPGQKALPESA